MEISMNFLPENETMNFPDDSKEGVQKAVFSVQFYLSLVVAVLTVSTNSLILAAFYMQRKLRTYTNWYILNITIADLVVGLFCMPFRSTILLYGRWNFGRVTGIWFLGFQNSILSVSVCGLVAICIDRYIATFYPIRHFQGKSIRKATVANILTWTISFGLWMTLTCVWDFVKPNYKISKSGFSRPNYNLNAIASVLVFILRFVLPFCVITGFYLRIYFRVKTSHSKRVQSALKKGHVQSKNSGPDDESVIQSVREESEISLAGELYQGTFSYSASDVIDPRNASGDESVIPSISSSISVQHQSSALDVKTGCTNDSDKNEASIDADIALVIDGAKSKSGKVIDRRPRRESTAEGRKAMRTLSFVILAFVVTWLPYAVNVTLYSFSSVINLQEPSRWISYSNSLINPVAYALAQPLIRETVLKIVRCRKS